MGKNNLRGTCETYFKRYAFRPAVISHDVHFSTKTIIVIPCYNEPNLLGTLESLRNGQPPQNPTEVIVVINSGEQADETIKANNSKTLKEAEAWIKQHQMDQLKVFILFVDDLPKKHAGVGLARKIGMDEALSRFAAIGFNGNILCLDADCTVSENYLVEIEKQFSINPKFGFASIHYEHLFDEVEDSKLKSGIISYELFLRYYIQGLKFAKFPFAMHTIGSSMAVKALAYAKSGGMNRRKAGEDFYFLHKLAPKENHLAIQNAIVYPSSRISDRVPFGTGKAQQDWLDGNSKIALTYDPQIFKDLKVFVSIVPELFEKEKPGVELEKMPESIKGFLKNQNFELSFQKIRKNSASQESYRKNFYQWFDGFKVLKYVHFARDHYYPEIPLHIAADKLLLEIGAEANHQDEKNLLGVFRSLDLSD
ncbi:glycosyltransferase family 2 protein [Flexithrix dorotheae]|uniref:glycosyltransferase family 2 protein n=1 Tax=Flexithrix dorotheae TaxID=70993 RepID=UPI000382DCB3|nr:glycosyltransferase family 2 protein [Flexithrix dorotheae]